MPDVNDILNNLDEELNKVTDTPPAEKDTPKDLKEVTEAEPAAPDDDGIEDAEEDDNDGYVIDETEPEEEEPSVEAPQQPTVTDEARFIYDNLPEIVTKDTDGNVIKVKIDNELPDDFDFFDKKTEIEFYKNLSAQELNARNLQQQYRQTQSTSQAQEFEQRENLGITRDIADLQREGALPKYKAAPNSPEFESDPAVVQSQEILDFMNKENDKYHKQYEKGMPYRHIGFREAFYMYKAQNPMKARSARQQEEDSQRVETARRTAGTTSTGPKPVEASRLGYGASSRDIFNFIDQLDI